MADLIEVIFVAPVMPWNPGETAGVPSCDAARLVANGWAVYVCDDACDDACDEVVTTDTPAQICTIGAEESSDNKTRRSRRGRR